MIEGRAVDGDGNCDPADVLAGCRERGGAPTTDRGSAIDARTTTFLASARAGYLAGAMIPVDRGLLRLNLK